MQAEQLHWLGIHAGASPGTGSGVSVTWWRDLTRTDVAELDLEAGFGPQPLVSETEFIAACRHAAEVSGLAQALLMPLDGVRAPRIWPSDTPLELEAHRSGVSFGPAALQRYLRGPGWGLWLTAEHLAGLGGRHYVRTVAPVVRVHERPTGLWLELTDSPWALSDEALDCLEAFLQPVLPTVEQIRAADPPETRQAEPQWTVTAADAYAEYTGPPIQFVWGPVDGVDVPINIHLGSPPSSEAAAALERAVHSWYSAGAAGWFPGGGLHDMRGPDWDGLTARWMVDMGHVDAGAALGSLGQRLAGWAHTWGIPIALARAGYEEPS